MTLTNFPVGQLQLLKEWDAIFPLIPGIDKEAPNAHEFAEELWEQLDHLGCEINSNSSESFSVNLFLTRYNCNQC